MDLNLEPHVCKSHLITLPCPSLLGYRLLLKALQVVAKAIVNKSKVRLDVAIKQMAAHTVGQIVCLINTL